MKDKHEMNSCEFVAWMLLYNEEKLWARFNSDLKLEFIVTVPESMIRKLNKEINIETLKFKCTNKKRKLGSNEFLVWMLFNNPEVLVARYNSELNLEFCSKISPENLKIPEDWTYDKKIGLMSNKYGKALAYRIKYDTDFDFLNKKL